MRAGELRIGNWVANHEGFPVVVLEIDRAMVLIDSSRDPKCFNTNNVHVKSLVAIPLTPDLLETAGCIRFSHSSSVINYKFTGFNSWFNADMKHFAIDFGKQCIAVHHLHELQALGLTVQKRRALIL